MPDVLLGDEEGITSVIAMITATGITVPGLLAFIAFNMTTVPCFAACATAKAELKKGTFYRTALFWIVSSFAISAAVYTLGSWWWTSFLWAAVIAVATTIIVLKNLGIIKPLRRRKKEATK